MKKCVIFCAGDFKELAAPVTAQDLVIAADSGLRHTEAIGLKPDIIMGDFDSLGYVPEGAEVYPVEKDDTDSMLAIKKGLEAGCDRFYIYGGLDGKWVDHTVANFQALHYLCDHGACGYLIGENQSPLGAYLDIPGIIEGAADGAGLGHDFLRHIDRCRLLVHVVDVSGSEGRDPVEDFDAICAELENYSVDLSNRPMIVAANKTDLLDPDSDNLERLRERVEEAGCELYEISAIFRPNQLFFRPWGIGYRRLLSCLTHIFVHDLYTQQLFAK